ncbi:hypothetical protein ACLB2K_042529 [Fragaria x ananassa]
MTKRGIYFIAQWCKYQQGDPYLLSRAGFQSTYFSTRKLGFGLMVQKTMRMLFREPWWLERDFWGVVNASLIGLPDKPSRTYLGHLIRGGEVIGEPSASYKANRTPAATSFIHGLKRLRLDSLEEAVIRETPTCAICLQDFAESAEELITCLPCKHHYHVNCIVLCLEINHICP